MSKNLTKEQSEKIADLLGVDSKNLEKVKVLSPEDYKKELNSRINSLVCEYFKENFLKRISKEMELAAKLSTTSLLLALSDLRQSTIALHEAEEKSLLGECFYLAEKLGAVSYAIYIAGEVDKGNKLNNNNSTVN